jgi:hypothetical protein
LLEHGPSAPEEIANRADSSRLLTGNFQYVPCTANLQARTTWKDG